MTTLNEATSSPELVPSIIWAVVRMIGALALLAGAAWALLRWSKRGSSAKESMRVVDRAVLTRGASLALVTVAGKRLLLGISNDGVRLLTDLEPAAAGLPPAEFEKMLDDTRRAEGNAR